MLRRAFVVFFALTLCSFGAPKKTRRGPQTRARIVQTSASYNPVAINNASLTETVGEKSQGAAVVRAQILLDRANFSVGEIDGSYGLNFHRAIAGFQKSRALPDTSQVDAATWEKLNADTAPALVPYKITQADIDGPYAPVPEDMMDKAKLPALGYASMLEMLGERFHVNPGAAAEAEPGEDILDRRRGDYGPECDHQSDRQGCSVVVSKADSTVTALDKDGKIIAQYPAQSAVSTIRCRWGTGRFERSREIRYFITIRSYSGTPMPSRPRRRSSRARIIRWA
jgi:Putative peptidoglycan-binding domain-containing protein